MKRIVRLLLLLFGTGAWWGVPAGASAATITIACGAVGIEYRLCRDGAQAWAKQSGHRVVLIQTPSQATERLALFQQLLAAGSSRVDVLPVDIVWPGILGRYLVDLRRYFDEETIDQHFPKLIANNTIDGELKAIPWYADAGLLYYRKDLLAKHGLQVPQTWAELADIAHTVVAAERANGHLRLVGFVFQGKAYEGLTCNALEWVASFKGGTILAPDGTVTIDNPQAIEALDTAASWIGAVAPKGVLNYAEEEARGVFQTGNAVFMRNWPYAWALANSADSPVRGKVEVAPLPQGGENGAHASTLGGGGLAVSIYSRHPAVAADFIRHFTGRKQQIRRAVIGSFNPTIPSAYGDPELRESQPFMVRLLPVLRSAVLRPTKIAGPDYNQVSSIFWNAVHDTLVGYGSAAVSLRDAEERLERLRRRAQW